MLSLVIMSNDPHYFLREKTIIFALTGYFMPLLSLIASLYSAVKLFGGGGGLLYDFRSAGGGDVHKCCTAHR